ncbi:MAG: TonB-dependent receptor plug domain-containing protein [Bacteroidetes bacterium]|nr:TonB-dependent receptor plug domain-containing protein [Bacteroidota bacterium]
MIANHLKQNIPFSQPSRAFFWVVKVAVVLALSQGNLTAQSLLDKPVSLTVQNTPVTEALRLLVKRNNVQLAYSEQFFSKKKKVTVRAKSQPMRVVLEQILAETGVGCREVGGQVVLFLLVEEVKNMTLSGFVEDAETGERLIAAAVYCPELGQGTVTNEYGFYSLTLPSTATNLRFNYIGYAEETVTLTKKESQRISLAIKPSLLLTEVVVTPTDTALGNLLPSPGNLRRFKPEDFKAAPDLGGQSDLFRVMQMLPGVQSSADGMGGMFVRGGNSDQNLVLMDGVPVYNAEHLIGMFSIFNTSAIRDAKLLKGGVPARYGGRISSVMDVYTKDGNQNRWGGEVGADLIGAKATLEGPFAKKKGTLMLSGRRTHSDFYLLSALNKILATDDFIDPSYYFFDFNAKVSYGFSEKDKLYLSFYRGKDSYGGTQFFEDEYSRDSSTFELKWGNTITSLRWNHLFNPKLFSNTSLTYSKFNFSLSSFNAASFDSGEPEDPPFSYSYFIGLSSDIQDLAWKTDFDYAPSANHYLRFGASITGHQFLPNAQVLEEIIQGGFEFDTLYLGNFLNLKEGDELNATSIDVYGEDEWRLGEKFTLNTGLRMSSFYSDGQFSVFPEPRVNAAFQVGRKQKITASFTRNIQYLHRVTTLGFLFPGDYWIPSNHHLGPQKAWQGTVGFEGKLPKSVQFNVEAYYKIMHGLLAFPDSFFFDPIFGEVSPEDLFISSTGKSRGLELLLRREEGRLGGWVGYGLSKTTRQASLLNIGKPYPFDFDRRHEVKLFAYYRIGNHWQASMNWVYGSPNPQITDEGKVESPPGQTNTLRSSPYHRLDLALSFSMKTGRLEHQLKASVFNAYNRKNVAFYTVDYDFNGNQSLKPVYIFPTMLGLFYGVKF